MDRGPPPVGGDQDRGTELLAVIWPFTILSLAVVSVKLYTRLRIIREPGFDDIFTAVSAVLVTICASLITASVRAGLGRHAYFLDPDQRAQAIKLNIIANPFGIMAYSLPNLSVAMFLNRILTLDRGRKWFIYAVAITQNMFAIVSSILVFKQCSPSSFLWNPSVAATCLPPDVLPSYSYFVGAYSAFTDVFLAIVPIIAFWKLQLRLRTKIGVSLLMSTTLCAAICAIVKTTKLHQLKDVMDFTYSSVDLLLWAVVESNVIIVAACVPSLRPFIVSATGKNFHDRKPGVFYGKHRALENSPYVVETIGSKRINRISLWSQSHDSLPPDNVIKKNTEILMEWERV